MTHQLVEVAAVGKQVDVEVSMLSGKTWSFCADESWTGQRLKQHYAEMLSIPLPEIMMVCGTVPIGDDEIFVATRSGDLLQCTSAPYLPIRLVHVKRLQTLSGGWDKVLRVWDLEHGKLLQELRGHSGAVNCLTIDWSSMLALSGSYDRSICLWDVQRGVCQRELQGHADAVNCICANWFLKRALSGSDDKTLRYWDLCTGEELMNFVGHHGAVNGLAVNWSTWCAISCGDDTSLCAWNLESGMKFFELRGHTDAVNCLSADFAANRILSGADDGVIFLWDLGEQEVTQKLEPSSCEVTDPHHGRIETAVNCIEMDWSSRKALSGSRDSVLRLWDLATGELLRVLQGHVGQVLCLAADWSSHVAISGSRDSALKLWDLRTGEILRSQRAHNYVVRCVAAVL